VRDAGSIDLYGVEKMRFVVAGAVTRLSQDKKSDPFGTVPSKTVDRDDK
jgi:hypothetical protein